MAGFAVGHRPHDRDSVERLRHERQVLADLHARQAGRDRPKLAADLGGGLGLQVERIDVTRPAPQKDVNHGHAARGLGRGSRLRAAA